MKNQLEKSSPPTTRPTTGMMMSLTSESTILPKAAPMMTPTARSTTLPLRANSRNSELIDIGRPSLETSAGRSPRAAIRRSNGGLARFAGANPHDLLDRGHQDLAVADLA